METSKTSIGETLNDLTLFAVDTLANHLAPQANEKAQTIHDTFGLGSEMPLAHYDQRTQSWRMSEDISLWGDYKLLENLPKSGMTQNGALYQQLDWVRPIDANASLLWPTPRNCTAMAATITPKSAWDQRRFPNLETVVGRREWPTPTTANWVTSTSVESTREAMLKGEKYSSRIVQAVAMEEPTATGYLNPMWVEWLMGFPIGWTDLED
jgi:hypothetical protein